MTDSSPIYEARSVDGIIPIYGANCLAEAIAEVHDGQRSDTEVAIHRITDAKWLADVSPDPGSPQQLLVCAGGGAPWEEVVPFQKFMARLRDRRWTQEGSFLFAPASEDYVDMTADLDAREPAEGDGDLPTLTEEDGYWQLTP